MKEKGRKEKKKDGRKEKRKRWGKKKKIGKTVTYVDSLKDFSHFKVSASLKLFPHPFSAVSSVQGSWHPAEFS